MHIPAAPTIQAHSPPDYSTRFARWLAVAVLLHAALLFIPARQALPPGQKLGTLTVALSRTLRATAPASAAESSQNARVIAEQPQAPPDAPAAQSAPASAPATTPAAAAELEPPAPASGAAAPGGVATAPVTTARLLDFAHRRQWNLPEPPSALRPGLFTPRPPLPDWRSGIPQEATAPSARTAIVDQWLAADGSHNVMVRTATGQLLCGRAEAWNPMSPLVEPVMMYRACGSGRRTFEMPERVLLR